MLCLVRIAAACVAALVLVSPSSAQRWEPLDADDPFPPHGTNVCTEAGGARLCLALYCAAPGEGLLLGLEDGARDVVSEVAEIWMAVDDPQVSNAAGGDPLTARLKRDQAFGHFVAGGAITEGLAAELIDDLKKGNTTYWHEAGNIFSLPLGGSMREITRVESICGPPALPEPVSLPTPEAEPEPDVAMANPTPEGQPAQEPQPAATASGETPVADAPVPTPETPIPAEPMVAAWVPVPPDESELVIGTELCYPTAAGELPSRCLRLLCFGQGQETFFWYEDQAIAEDAGALPLTVTAASGDTGTLGLTQSTEAAFLIATARPDGALLSALAGDGLLTVSLPAGDTRVQATGAAQEFARLAAICALPEKAAMAPKPAEGQVDTAAAGSAVPEGGVPTKIRVDVDQTDWSTLDALTQQFVGEVHGEDIEAYRASAQQNLTGFGTQAFDLGEGRYLLVTKLCGAGSWFGAKGCMVYVNAREAGVWTGVFSDSTLAYGTSLDLDPAAIRDGWPDLIVDGGAVRWAFADGRYQVVR